MSRASISLAVIAFALLAAVSGCGSSGGESTPTASPPLTKAQFEKQAKALCKAESHKYYEEALAVSHKLQHEGKKVNLQVQATILQDTVVPGMERKLEAVRAFKPPSAGAAQVDRILTAIEKVVAEAKTNPKLFIYRQVHFKRPFHHANELAKGYGLSACARA